MTRRAIGRAIRWPGARARHRHLHRHRLRLRLRLRLRRRRRRQVRSRIRITFILTCNSGGGFNLLANDTDPDGFTMSLTSVHSNGSFTISVGSASAGIASIGSGPDGRQLHRQLRGHGQRRPQRDRPDQRHRQSWRAGRMLRSIEAGSPKLQMSSVGLNWPSLAVLSRDVFRQAVPALRLGLAVLATLSFESGAAAQTGARRLDCPRASRSERLMKTASICTADRSSSASRTCRSVDCLMSSAA